MTAYNVTRTNTLSPDVAARKAARKKVIERAHKLEQESYLGMMKKKRLRYALFFATITAANDQLSPDSTGNTPLSSCTGSQRKTSESARRSSAHQESQL